MAAPFALSPKPVIEPRPAEAMEANALPALGVSPLVLSALVGGNAALFARAFQLHAPRPPATLVDSTYGSGVFWQALDLSGYTTRFTDLSSGVDARALPYPDHSADVVVLDPPYAYNPKGTIKASISASYRLNESAISIATNADVLALYAAMMAEAARVLRPGGRAFVKCQDIIESGIQRWNHVTILGGASALGWYGLDLFVLVQAQTPARRWATQHHARRNHSYLWVFAADAPKLARSVVWPTRGNGR